MMLDQVGKSNQKDILPVDQRQDFTISVVVPVYNSQGTLAELVQRLQTVLSNLTTAFEIILVNDGSRDRSEQVISDLVARFSFVQGINLMRNYGQHNALLAGIRAANYGLLREVLWIFFTFFRWYKTNGISSACKSMALQVETFFFGTMEV